MNLENYPGEYPGTYLKTEPFDIRYKIVADYFSKTNEATDGMVVLDLNCGEPRFFKYIKSRRYLANDVYMPDDIKGIVFLQTTDDKMDCSSDILCCFGYGGGEFTGHPLESKTTSESIYRLARHNPKYIVLEMSMKWEQDYKIMSTLIKNLSAYEVVLERKYEILPAEHYHDKRQLTILKKL